MHIKYKTVRKMIHFLLPGKSQLKGARLGQGERTPVLTEISIMRLMRYVQNKKRA